MSLNSLPVPTPTGSVSRSGRRVLISRALPALLLALAVLSLPGCGPRPPVTTSTGAVVPAATVQAQDIAGDALSVLQDVHNAAVRAHDAKAGAEPADVHAKRRTALLASASGLRAAWDGLSAWKAGSEGRGLAGIAAAVRPALPELLRAAVSLGVVSQGTADTIGAFFEAAGAGLTPKPLTKPTVVSVLQPAGEIDWRAAVQPFARYSTVLQPEGYFDGCNWHRPLGGGAWVSTLVHCQTVNAGDLYVQGVPR